MAKRFTDTTKWDNPWYRKMPWQYRDLWDYITDKCDHAGIWRADLETASFIIGETVTEKGAYEHFGERVKFFKEDKWFIPGFVPFQYGENLNPKSKIHASVIEKLKNLNPLLSLSTTFPNTNVTLSNDAYETSNPLIRVKDKEEDKDKVKDKEKEKEERAAYVKFLQQQALNKKNDSAGAL